ncbi:MAG: hypothetical protein JJLCMIEE_01181 [Acidimicrobiales bacterium]|nr:hypothetical protein [Acidimicrobiales bacterium]
MISASRRSRRARVLVVVAAAAVLAASCAEPEEDQATIPITGGSPGSDASETTESASASTEPTPLGAADEAALQALLDANPGCELLDDRSCLLPFPSNQLTIPSEETDTGLLVNLPPGGVPANSAGVPIDVTEWNRNDGFSPGSVILLHVPGVDLEASGAAPIGDIEESLTDDSAVVLVDMETGDRVPHWVELDSTAESPEDQLVMIRPAVNLTEGHTFAVGIRNLVDESGDSVEAELPFRVYRDNLTTGIEPVEARRESMENVISALGEEGVERGDLYLAWDFTVASERNLSERLLHIRDDAFAELGEDAPEFAVTEVIEDSPGLPEGIERRVKGTFEVPLYLTGAGEPGSRFNYGEDGLPAVNGTFTANFNCQIPESTVTDGVVNPARPVVYGHGLLGSNEEAESDHIAKVAEANTMMYCATDWIGMAEDDVPNAISILSDLGQFATLADRVQQGILNTLFMSRLMVLGQGRGGFADDPAFQSSTGAPLIDTGIAYYDSNSQGAIIGGAATAVALDWEKAVLGVPGMNYSLLLQRSTDFVSSGDEPGFSEVLQPAYPSKVDQAILLALIQMLWDRAETNGYAQHLTSDPYPDTPEHDVILHVAFGDHQVAQVAAEIEARTIGALLYSPALAEGRHPDTNPFVGMKLLTAEEMPYEGSVLVYWDSGTLPPPGANIPPTQSEEWLAQCTEESEDPACLDPHEDPRRQEASIEQKDAFFLPNGVVIDVCDGAPCVAIPASVLEG